MRITLEEGTTAENAAHSQAIVTQVSYVFGRLTWIRDWTGAHARPQVYRSRESVLDTAQHDELMAVLGGESLDEAFMVQRPFTIGPYIKLTVRLEARGSTRDTAVESMAGPALEPAVRSRLAAAQRIVELTDSWLPERTVPENLSCSTDADCGVSCFGIGSCCRPLCECNQVASRSTIERVAAWNREHCGSNAPDPIEEDLPCLSGGICPPATHQTIARCVDGACVAEQVPITH